ncbi:MAG: hypothetical protein IPH62_11440 [Ignavibacteriae bacterium]|nr:hypothetical protein [Ignavibacteriota bacterium]
MYKFFKHIIMALIFSAINWNAHFSQSLNFQHYSTDNGLPQSTVYDIVQDSAGFIWFGTEAGIGRFDGIKVKTYSLAEGLVGTNVWSLFMDKHGTLWIGTNDGLSLLFEDEIRSFTTTNGLSDNFIWGITNDKDDNIWVATRYGGACKFEGKKITQFTEENGFPSNELSDIITDSKGNIWFSSSNKGIIKYNGKKFQVFNSNNGLKSNNVTTIFEDSDGLLWIGTDRGISTFNGKNFYNFSSQEGFPEEEISVILEDANGNMWFGLYNNGILRYDGRKLYRHEGLQSDEIRSGFVDRRGDIWFGTFLGGVSRLPADWFEIYSTSNGLADRAVYPIAQDENGRMYFGHYGRGVTVLDNGYFSRLTTASGLIGNDLSSILFDNKKNLWFGTLSGVTKFGKDRVQSFDQNNGLRHDKILKIFEDSQGYIWLGAAEGISRYSPQTGSISEILTDIQGFKRFEVNDIIEDNIGNIWFATHYSGLLKYNGKNFQQIDTANGLSINNIFSIMQDEYGYFWLGTDGGGIIRYDGKKFRTITEKDGLSSNVCYFILEDNHKLYIGTLNGLSILDNKKIKDENKIKFRYLTKNEGIPDKELNQKSYFKDKDGFLWFGTMKGLIKINPDKEALDENPSVFLTNAKVSDGQNEIPFNPFNQNELDYNQNNISFEFYSISFAKPEETIFEIKLEGIENNWSVTKEHTVTYRALPSGNYNFWVRARNSDNVTGEARILSSFTISPPFYKTWWFITLSILSILGFAYYIYYYKTLQVQKRNEALEGMVKKRTSELEIEKNKSDELLHNILPASLVNELKINGRVKPRKFTNVSILFTDFKAFTYTTSVLPPEELVNELNDIFKSFDKLIDKYGLEKLKTIGDSYMAACGIPNEIEDHAVRIVYAAIDFQRLIKDRNKTSGIKWEMRLGIHSGSVVAGVVGTKKFTYDIWGDTVNIASRMESSGEPGEINISGYTYMLVRDHFECEYRGKVDTKGKGSIDMYYVKGLNRENIILKNKTTQNTQVQFKHIG